MARWGWRTYGVHEPKAKVWLMPPTRTQVLIFVREEIARGRSFPANTEIRKALGLGTDIVTQSLYDLHRRGHIRRVGRSTTGRRHIIYDVVP